MNKEELHADNRKLFEELDNKNPELLNKILSNVGNLMSFKDLADSSIGAFNNLINELIKNTTGKTQNQNRDVNENNTDVVMKKDNSSRFTSRVPSEMASSDSKTNFAGLTYYNYPSSKIDLFEMSDKNYFFASQSFSYLCSYDEYDRVDPNSSFKDAYVLSVLKRYCVVRNGKIIFFNDNFNDGHSPFYCQKEGFQIITNKPVMENGDSAWDYYVRDENSVVIYNRAETAVNKAIELSINNPSQQYLVAQTFEEIERR
ncbi:MAG: hypothetical protein IJ263_05960 [Paludibacteraceae bacterium]|nr:hypothetical protein [Paludibacteraceae bacterium]